MAILNLVILPGRVETLIKVLNHLWPNVRIPGLVRTLWRQNGPRLEKFTTPRSVSVVIHQFQMFDHQRSIKSISTNLPMKVAIFSGDGPLSTVPIPTVKWTKKPSPPWLRLTAKESSKISSKIRIIRRRWMIQIFKYLSCIIELSCLYCSNYGFFMGNKII